MTILVDELITYPEYMISDEAKRRGHSRKPWCHMVSDESELELHVFAQKIGIKRSWFQGDHYDLTEGMRKRAIGYGAVEVDAIDLVRRNCLGRFRCEK